MWIKSEHLLIHVMEHCYNRCIRATLAAGSHTVKYCWIMQEQAILWIIKTLIEFCMSIFLPRRMTDSLPSETSSFWQLLKADFQSVTEVAVQDRKAYVLVTEVMMNCHYKICRRRSNWKKTNPKAQKTTQVSVLNIRFGACFSFHM